MGESCASTTRFTPERLDGLMRRTSRTVKAALLDQSGIAGLGNIYVDEACHLAGIRPTRRARRLTRKERAALHAAIRSVLTKAVANRGTTVDDYRDLWDARGSHQEELQVYGRGGEPCRTPAAPPGAARSCAGGSWRVGRPCTARAASGERARTRQWCTSSSGGQASDSSAVRASCSAALQPPPAQAPTQTTCPIGADRADHGLLAGRVRWLVAGHPPDPYAVPVTGGHRDGVPDRHSQRIHHPTGDPGRVPGAGGPQPAARAPPVHHGRG